MLKQITAAGLAALFLFVSVGLVIAAGKGNARKGKYLYRKSCRTCHINGGSAGELSPVSKTQAQWDKVFTDVGTLACKDEWAKLSDKDRTDIYAHLWGHASDSPMPAKCK
ncbi:MAG: cytochrome c [Desulfobacterales bacterium]|nr:cytochrome c [Desulfobacterales bacterium]